MSKKIWMVTTDKRRRSIEGQDVEPGIPFQADEVWLGHPWCKAADGPGDRIEQPNPQQPTSHDPALEAVSSSQAVRVRSIDTQVILAELEQRGLRAIEAALEMAPVETLKDVVKQRAIFPVEDMVRLATNGQLVAECQLRDIWPPESGGESASAPDSQGEQGGAGSDPATLAPPGAPPTWREFRGERSFDEANTAFVQLDRGNSPARGWVALEDAYNAWRENYLLVVQEG